MIFYTLFLLSLSGTSHIFVSANTDPYEVIPMADEPKENEAFNLTCSGPSELLQVFWYRNNKPVTLDRWMSLSRKNATLSFSKLLESHSGYYLCQASIGTVTIQSTEYLLTFDSIILMITGPDTVEVGETAVFRCLVNCSFGCSIFWTYKNGFPSGTYVQRGATINWTPSIPNITQNFTCVAENPESGQSASAHKSVRITDRKPTKPTNQPKSGADELIFKMPKGVAIAVWLSFILGF